MVDLLTEEQLSILNMRCEFIKNKNIGEILNSIIIDINDGKVCSVDLSRIKDSVDSQCIFYKTLLGDKLQEIIDATKLEQPNIQKLDFITLSALNNKCACLTKLQLGDKIQSLLDILNNKDSNINH